MRMIYNQKISEMEYGQDLEGFYILKAASNRTTAAGKPFLTAEYADRSGSIDGIVWDYPGPITAADVGKIVKIRGKVAEYRGARQFATSRIRLAEEHDTYDLSALVPVAPIDTEATLRYVQETVASIEDSDYRAIAQTLLERHGAVFSHIPAAKSIHHGFLSGLLMHTSNMLRIADFLARLYSGVIDRSLLLAGVLLHDFMKREEFRFSELGLVAEYSVRGQLLGHLVMEAQEVADTARELKVPEEKSMLLQHLILSHHGDPEFGAAVRPMCAEAELLWYIDGVDSRMEIFAETFSTVPEGTFSPKVYALDRKIYHHTMS